MAMTRYSRRMWLALAAVSACSLTAEAAARRGIERVPKVGVVIATRVNVAFQEAERLADRLGEAVREELEVDVVAGAEAGRRLPPAGVPEDCVVRPACVRELATRLDADQILFLVMVQIGPRLQIDPTWADPQTGDAASRPALVFEDGGPAADLVFARAPRQLLPHETPRVSARLVARSGGSDRPGRRVTSAVGVSGATALVAMAGGLGLAASARSDYNALEEAGCAERSCPDQERRIDRMERKAVAADMLIAAAAIAGATSVVLYLRSGAKERSVRVGAGPLGRGERGAYLSVGGRF